MLPGTFDGCVDMLGVADPPFFVTGPAPRSGTIRIHAFFARMTGMVLANAEAAEACLVWYVENTWESWVARPVASAWIRTPPAPEIRARLGDTGEQTVQALGLGAVIIVAVIVSALAWVFGLLRSCGNRWS